MDESPLCVFEYRYGSIKLRSLFQRKNILRRLIDVEIALMKALEEVGYAPKGCYERLKKCAYSITPEEVNDYEVRLGHEMASLVTLIGERCGSCGNFVHLGATSSDIIDTATALIIRDSLEVVMKKLRKVIERLIDLSLRHKHTLMVGRTHGQHALPITFGFKVANYVYELSRSYERLCQAKDRVIKGVISGAVGTMAAWGDNGLRIEEITLNELGLKPHAITTQVAPRDGMAELIIDLALLASQLDRLALEVRELSRNEIGEILPYGGEVGSSTMPHKTNPTIAERVSGLAKVSRGFVVTALENIALMHERDLTNSSSERVTIPHAFLTIDQMLEDTLEIIRNLKIDEESMLRNLNISKGAVMAECLMTKLVVKKGIPRHIAYRKLSLIAKKALNEGKELLELFKDSDLASMLEERDIEFCRNYRNYLGSYEMLINRAIRESRKAISRC